MTRGFKLIACILCAIAVHGVIFVATDAGLRAANAALKAHGPGDVGSVEWSHRYYYDYASEALAGKVPYRDFAFEYPVLSYPLFLIPRLLVSDFESYRFAFEAEMFLFDVAAIVLIARHGGEKEEVRTVARRLGWYTLYCFLLAPLVIGRFELAPMVLAFAAAQWWFSGRAILGGITAGLGTLMKIFPGVVAAPALVWEASRLGTTRARGMTAFLATLAAGLAFWFSLGGRRVLESLGYHAARGLEVESLYGGALFLVGMITGEKVPWVLNYNAYHVAPEWGARLAILAFPLQAAALLVVMWGFRRSGMADGLAVLCGRGALLYRLRQGVIAAILDLAVPVHGGTGRRHGQRGTEDLPSCLLDYGDVLPRTRLRDGSRASVRADPALESSERAPGMVVCNARLLSARGPLL